MLRITKFFVSVVWVLLAVSSAGVADDSLAMNQPVPNPQEYVQDQILVRFKPGTPASAMAAAHVALGAQVMRAFTIVSNLSLVRLPAGVSVKEAIARYRADKNVLYAEPNMILKAVATYPGDPLFNEQWGLENTGQAGGTIDADIDAPEAWDITTGSTNVVVAVIDTGIAYTHKDLQGNMWRNADCDSDGTDDDGNKYIDDCYGIDTFNGDADPLDDNGHGTHVAGTVGAVGDNALGVVGVSWQARLMACKFLSAEGWGTLEGALACLEYVQIMKDRGVNIVATNNSWGGGGFSQALFDAIAAHLSRGILFIAAAGNWGENHDSEPDFFAPSGYYLPNIISVAATNRYDALAWFSDYGRRTVHVGAPGEEILSTVPGDNYEYFSGTSMAAPHVTGVVALLKAQDPSRDWRAIKNLILAGGDTLGSLSNTITQKRLSAYGALTCSNSVIRSRLRPVQDEIFTAAGSAINLAALHINCASPNGAVTVAVSPGGSTVVLQDNGAGFDQVAGDGIYSGQWVPSSGGLYTLIFPDGDTVAVKVLNSYNYSAAPFSWRDITALGIGLELVDDSSVQITSPFPIPFGDFASAEQLFVSSNGVISFAGHFQEFENIPLPVPFIANVVAPFWDDLSPIPGSSHNVFVAVIGSAPHRELVIEWRDLPHFSCSGDLTATVKFQVVFFEGRSDILFQYADTRFRGACAWADEGASATIGIQAAPQRAIQFSFNAPDLEDKMALLWTTPAHPCPTVTVTPSRATLSYTKPNQIASVRVTLRNSGFSPVWLHAIAPQEDEHFSIVRVLPRLPLPLGPGRSRSVLVQTRGPATGPFPVLATSPYFTLTLDCGTVTTASVVPLQLGPVRVEERAGLLQLEARGAGIESVQIQLFDLSGRTLIDQQSAGAALTVLLVNNHGQRLAKGVYLYVVTLYSRDGTVWRSEVRKLIVK